MNRLFLSLPILLLGSTPIRADMGFPGMKQAKVAIRIQSDQTFPDHYFLIARFHRHPDPRKTEASKEYEAEYVDAGRFPIEVHGLRREGVYLVIVPRRDGELAAKAIAESGHGGQRIELSFDESVPEWYGKEFTINYSLRQTSASRFELDRTSWRPANQCCVVAVLIPVGCMLGGLWLIRKLWRKRKLNRTPLQDELPGQK